MQIPPPSWESKYESRQDFSTRFWGLTGTFFEKIKWYFDTFFCQKATSPTGRKKWLYLNFELPTKITVFFWYYRLKMMPHSQADIIIWSLLKLIPFFCQKATSPPGRKKWLYLHFELPPKITVFLWYYRLKMMPHSLADIIIWSLLKPL